MNLKDTLSNYKILYIQKYQSQSESTLQSKLSTIGSFIDSLPDDISYIHRSDIDKWAKGLSVTTNSLNGKLVIIRQFLLFIRSFGVYSDLPAIQKYTDNYVPYLFTDDEIAQILEVADNIVSCSRVASTKAFCFPMILRLLMFCGMRLGEVLKLRISDFDSESGIIHIHRAKGNKERLVPLHQSLSYLLSLYITRLLQVFPGFIYMFPDNSGLNPLTKNQVEYEFRKIITHLSFINNHQRNGRGICMHCFRHTFAVRVFQLLTSEGLDVSETIPVLSTYLGHKSLFETEKYLKFAYDMFPEEASRFDSYTDDVFGGLL